MTSTLSADELTRISDTVARSRARFESGVTRPLAWRRGQLTALARLLNEHEARSPTPCTPTSARAAARPCSPSSTSCTARSRTPCAT